jgi:alpha,alpha-trehalose phosphorylase
VVAGFGGLRDHGTTLSFAPRLPSRLTRLSFGLLYRGRRLRVHIAHDAAQYELLAGEPLEIRHYGEDVTVTAGTPERRPLPPLPQYPAPGQPAGRSPSANRGV